MITGIIGAAAGALGNVFGGISKNKMLKEQMKAVREEKAKNQNWYNMRYNEDATQRADAQALLTKTADAIRERNRASSGSQAVMGGTDEGVAADKAANAKALSDAASNIVAANESRKDNIEQQYRAQDAAYNEQLRALKRQKQSVLDIAGGAVGGAASGFMAGVGLDGNSKS